MAGNSNQDWLPALTLLFRKLTRKYGIYSELRHSLSPQISLAHNQKSPLSIAVVYELLKYNFCTPNRALRVKVNAALGLISALISNFLGPI